MNYSTVIFLINDDVRALYVIYGKDEPPHKQQRYMVKTFDRQIVEGDYVVVPSTMGHDNLVIAKVTDVNVEVDFDSTTVVPWVVCRVDMAEFNDVVTKEAISIGAVRQAHFVAKKKTLAKDLMEARDLLKLPLAKRADLE